MVVMPYGFLTKKIVFHSMSRADSVRAINNHSIYRVYRIPGLSHRETDLYDGTGIIKTYDTSAIDEDYPPDENAQPDLITTETNKRVMNKRVEHHTATCDVCQVDGRVDDRGVPFCPSCGLVLVDPDQSVSSHQLRLTPNSANRFTNE